MSFSIQAAGTREQVRAQVTQKLAEIQRYGGNNRQAAAAAELIEQHLGMATLTNGMFVEANGHCDQYNCSLTLTIRSLAIPVAPEPEPEPTAYVEPDRARWTTETGLTFEAPPQ